MVYYAHFQKRLTEMKIILASKSPRRREILENLGLEFDIVVADADESSDIFARYLLATLQRLSSDEG